MRGSIEHAALREAYAACHHQRTGWMSPRRALIYLVAPSTIALLLRAKVLLEHANIVIAMSLAVTLIALAPSRNLRRRDVFSSVSPGTCRCRAGHRRVGQARRASGCRDAAQSSGRSFLRSSLFRVDRRTPCHTVLKSAGYRQPIKLSQSIICLRSESAIAPPVPPDTM
jgi:hypothetical protein